LVFELLFTHPLWAYRAGKLTLAGAWPRWLLWTLIAVAAAVIVASLLRRRQLGWRLWVLGGLQVALAALVLCLLWRPVLNVERVRDRQNVLAVLLDTSGSMAQTDATDTTRLQQAIGALQGGPLAELKKVFELRFFTFDRNSVPLNSLEGAPISLPPPGVQTRIGDALLNVAQTAGSVPLAAMVLVSDGAENGRSLSEANIQALASYGVPVHTIGVGPEQPVDDLELDSVELPASVTAAATVTADVSVRHSALRQSAVQVRVYDRDVLLAAREVQLIAHGAPGVTTAHLEFPAGDAGARDLRFVVQPLDNERNTANNTRRAALTVSGARRSILYVEGEPRWEFKFVRRALDGERALRLASVVRTTQNKFYRQGISSGAELSEGVPTRAEELFAYDAVVIGSYEAAALTPAQHELLKQFVDRRGGGLLMLAARNGLAAGGWSNSVLSQVLPVHLANKRDADFPQVPTKVALTEYGAAATILRLDADPQRNGTLWQGLPSLANYQSVGSLKPGAVVLLEGKTQSGPETRMPLLVWQRFGRGSAYVLATASTQRWQMSLPPEDQRHEVFWRQLMLAVAEQAPQRAWLGSDRTAYEDERSVQVRAELRDAKFEPLTAAAKPGAKPNTGNGVEVLVTPEQGTPFLQTLQPIAGEPGSYAATVDAPSAGMYRLDLTAYDADGTALTAGSAFRRDDNVVEHFAAYQHRAVLERVAAATGGRYWTLSELQNLSRAIPYSKSGIVERQVLDLWNLPIVFLILLALKLAEWLLRLRWGTL
jgi:uncharacterized membrane protein